MHILLTPIFLLWKTSFDTISCGSTIESEATDLGFYTPKRAYIRRFAHLLTFVKNRV